MHRIPQSEEKNKDSDHKPGMTIQKLSLHLNVVSQRMAVACTVCHASAYVILQSVFSKMFTCPIEFTLSESPTTQILLISYCYETSPLIQFQQPIACNIAGDIRDKPKQSGIHVHNVLCRNQIFLGQVVRTEPCGNSYSDHCAAREAM